MVARLTNIKAVTLLGEQSQSSQVIQKQNSHEETDIAWPHLLSRTHLRMRCHGSNETP